MSIKSFSPRNNWMFLRRRRREVETVVIISTANWRKACENRGRRKRLLPLCLPSFPQTLFRWRGINQKHPVKGKASVNCHGRESFFRSHIQCFTSLFSFWLPENPRKTIRRLLLRCKKAVNQGNWPPWSSHEMNQLEKHLILTYIMEISRSEVKIFHE